MGEDDILFESRFVYFHKVSMYIRNTNTWKRYGIKVIVYINWQDGGCVVILCIYVAGWILIKLINKRYTKRSMMFIELITIILTSFQVYVLLPYRVTSKSLSTRYGQPKL